MWCRNGFHADLPGANLTRANLTRAYLTRAYLSGAHFSPDDVPALLAALGIIVEDAEAEVAS